MANPVCNQDKTDHTRPPRLRWELVLVVVIIHLGALLAVFPSHFSLSAVGVAIVLHCITIGLGISLGYHRLASHRSFKVPKALVLYQGSYDRWKSSGMIIMSID